MPLAALCALAYLGVAAHFALVEHATCALHGELLHAAGAPDLAKPAERFADARIAAAEWARDTGHGAELHCSVALRRRELPRERCTLERPPRPLPAVAAFRVRLPPAEPVARLHLAPKASPPRG